MIKDWKKFNEDLNTSIDSTDLTNQIIPVGTKIKFSGKDCQIISHWTKHGDTFYQIRYTNGDEEFVVSRDNRIETHFK